MQIVLPWLTFLLFKTYQKIYIIFAFYFQGKTLRWFVNKRKVHYIIKWLFPPYFVNVYTWLSHNYLNKIVGCVSRYLSLSISRYAENHLSVYEQLCSFHIFLFVVISRTSRQNKIPFHFLSIYMAIKYLKGTLHDSICIFRNEPLHAMSCRFLSISCQEISCRSFVLLDISMTFHGILCHVMPR